MATDPRPPDGAPPYRSPSGLPPWNVPEGFVLFLAFLVVQVFVSQLPALPGVPALSLGGQLAASNALVLSIVYLFLRRKTAGPIEALRAVRLCRVNPLRMAKKSLLPLTVGIAALIGWGIIQGAILSHFEIEIEQQPVVNFLRRTIEQDRPGQALLLAALAEAAVPVVEEIVFRALLYLPMRQRIGPVPAALCISAIFSLVHGYIPGLGHFFILGLLFTWLLENTETLLAPIMTHAVHNGLMIALLFTSIAMD